MKNCGFSSTWSILFRTPAQTRAATGASYPSRYNSSKFAHQARFCGAGYAPYLDYRPLDEAEAALLKTLEEPAWLRKEIEDRAMNYAAVNLVPEHLQDVKSRKEALANKTMAAVKERLTVEINYWDHRAEQLKQQEAAGKVNAKINSAKARQTADELTTRLGKRMDELKLERMVSPLPPHVMGGALIVPLPPFCTN